MEGLNIRAELLSFLADPTAAYLVFIAGGILVLAEIIEPGRAWPGIAGAVMTILSARALAGFEWTWYGEALLVLALGLAMVRLRTCSYFLPLLPAAAFASGSALLLKESAIHPLAAAIGGFFAWSINWLLRLGYRARIAKRTLG